MAEPAGVEQERRTWVGRRQALLRPKRTPHFAAYWANKRVACRLFLSAKVAEAGQAPVWKVQSYNLSGLEPAVRRRDLVGLRGVVWRWWVEEWARLGATEAEARRAWIEEEAR